MGRIYPSQQFSGERLDINLREASRLDWLRRSAPHLYATFRTGALDLAEAVGLAERAQQERRDSLAAASDDDDEG